MQSALVLVGDKVYSDTFAAETSTASDSAMLDKQSEVNYNAVVNVLLNPPFEATAP